MNNTYQFTGELYISESKKPLNFIFDSAISKSWIKPNVLNDVTDESSNDETTMIQFKYGNGTVTGTQNMT